jgi:hypothetical protein
MGQADQVSVLEQNSQRGDQEQARADRRQGDWIGLDPKPIRQDDQVVDAIEFAAARHLGHGPAEQPGTETDLVEKTDQAQG